MAFKEYFGNTLGLNGLFFPYAHEFNVAMSYQDRVEVVDKYMHMIGLVPTLVDQSFHKCSRSANWFRRAGNDVLSADPQSAILFYNQSILSAPTGSDSSDLALGYANRSAVLKMMEMYADSVTDIDRALALNYPKNLKYKLLERKGTCLKQIGEVERANICFKEAAQALASSQSLPPAKLQLKLSELRNMRRNTVTQKKEADDTRTLPMLTSGQHKAIACLADIVKVTVDPKKGIQLVASRDIDPGDVLIMEEPLTSTPFLHHRLQYCFHCLKQSVAMVPCRQCCLVFYCSESCRDESWNFSHDVACAILPRLLDDFGASKGLTRGSLELQMFLVSVRKCGGLSELKAKTKELKKGRFEDISEYSSSKYEFLHYMKEHVSALDQVISMEHSMLAAHILNCLEASPAIEIPTRMRKFVGGLLLKFMFKTKSNLFPVAECELGTSGNGVLHNVIGFGIYPVTCMATHSCCSNTAMSFFNGDTQGRMARRTIRKGQQICLANTMTYVREPKNVRTEMLDTMGITCDCKACVNDWPLLPDLAPLNKMAYLCPQCAEPLRRSQARVPCRKCAAEVDVHALTLKATELSRESDAISLKMITGCREDHTKALGKVVKQMETLVLEPCLVLYLCSQHLDLSFKALGNRPVEVRPGFFTQMFHPVLNLLAQNFKFDD